MRSRTARRAALLLAGGAAAAALAGCGSGTHATPAGLRLQREDLTAAAQGLSEGRPEIDAEVAATKAVWRSLYRGLPRDISSLPLGRIGAAERRAASLKVPSIFQEARAQGLTGPATGIAGLFRSSVVLVMRGWQMIGYDIEQAQRGSPSAASFARRTVALYLESIYDANFGLAQEGKKLVKGYEKLEGPSSFGGSLSEAEVQRLAGHYSEPRYRLYPHTGVKFGT